MNSEQGVVEKKPSLAELQLKMCCHFFILRAEERLGEIPEAIEDRLFVNLTYESLQEIARLSVPATTCEELVAGL